MNVLFLRKLFFYSLFHKIILASAVGKSQSNQINGCKQAFNLNLLTTAKELVDSVPKEISDPNLNDDAIEGWHKKYAGILCCVNFVGIETKNFLDGKKQENYFKEIQRNFCNELENGKLLEKNTNKMEKYWVNFPKILQKIQQSIQKMMDQKQKLMQKNALITKKNKEQFQMLIEQLNAGMTMVSNLSIGGGSNEMPLHGRRAKRMRSIEITSGTMRSSTTSQVNNNRNNNNNSRMRTCAKAFVGFTSIYYLLLIIPGIEFANNHQLNLTGIILIVIAAVLFLIQMGVAYHFKLLFFGNGNN